jgi:hypothetical protein
MSEENKKAIELVASDGTSSERSLLKPEEEELVGFLSPSELMVLKEYRSAGHPPLAPKTASAFFNLFCQEKSTREIYELNKSFPYGAIVDARIRYKWDLLKNEYISSLHENVKNRLIKAQMESVSFLADVMSATHKKYGSRIAKYLQSGDENDLGGFEISTVAQYNKAIEGLLKISGQDQKKIKLEASGPSSSQNSNGEQETTNKTKLISPSKAAQILKILTSEEET